MVKNLRATPFLFLKKFLKAFLSQYSFYNLGTSLHSYNSNNSGKCTSLILLVSFIELVFSFTCPLDYVFVALFQIITFYAI